MNQPDYSSDVLIVGAGLCGLSAAMTLAESGVKPIILEKRNRVGGLARSIELAGRYFDIGVHTLYKNRASKIEYLLDKIEIDWLRRKNNYSIVINGQKISPVPELANFWKYPTELKIDLTRKFKVRKRENTTLEDRLKWTYGQWLYERFVGNYIGKKLPGYTGAAIHGDWWGLGNIRIELNRFPDDNHHGTRSITERFKSGISRWSGFLFGQDNVLLYPRKGIGEISEGLETSLRKKGISVIFDVTPTEIIIKNNRFVGMHLSDGRAFMSNNIIWTGQLLDLLNLIGLKGSEDLPHISTAVVLFVFEKKSNPKRRYLFEYISERNCIFQRYYYDDFYYGENSEFGICCEISYKDRNDLPDEEVIISLAMKDLIRLGAIDSPEVIEAHVHFEPDSHPIYKTDYRRSLARIFKEIYSIDGIFPTGRSGSFNNIGMHATMEAGSEAANHCLLRMRSSRRMEEI